MTTPTLNNTMNLYPIAKPFLFAMDPETAHDVTLTALDSVKALGIQSLVYPKVKPHPVEVMGLHFENPIGLAAGMDKNGDHIDSLGDLGFGFLEIGTVTPLAQPGNPGKRLFRLPEHKAIINRMGFNNKGVDYAVKNVKASAYTGPIGINIGKNAKTNLTGAVDDYLYGLEAAYTAADYIVINISSPNTPGLNDLQRGPELEHLLLRLKKGQYVLADKHGAYTPLVIKVSSDLALSEIVNIARLLKKYDIDGVIAANTTTSRYDVMRHKHAGEAGGLSGAPLTHRATWAVRELAEELEGRIPIIASGGVMTAADARDKLAAGASLVQVFTGLIYSGPQLIADIANIL